MHNFRKQYGEEDVLDEVIPAVISQDSPLNNEAESIRSSKWMDQTRDDIANQM